jgi:hypothetical protein
MKRKRFSELPEAEKVTFMRTFTMSVQRLDEPQNLNGRINPGFLVADLRSGKHSKAGRAHHVTHLGEERHVDTTPFVPHDHVTLVFTAPPS